MTELAELLEQADAVLKRTPAEQPSIALDDLLNQADDVLNRPSQELLTRVAANNAEIAARQSPDWNRRPSGDWTPSPYQAALAMRDPRMAMRVPQQQPPSRLDILNRFRDEAGLPALNALPGPRGVAEVWEEDIKWTDPIPYVGVLADAVYLGDVYDAALRAEDGRATGKDWELLVGFQDQLLRESREKTIPAQATNILIHSIPFMAEFLTSGGLVAGGKVAAKKGATTAAKKGLSAAIKSAIGKAAGFAAESAIRTPFFAHRIGAETIRRMIPEFQLAPEETGDLQYLQVKEGESLAEAAKNAGLDILIEIASESSGPALAAIGRKAIGRAAAQPAKRMLVKDFLSRAGYHGILEEVGEERVGEALREAVTRLGIADLPQTIPTPQQLAAETLAFAAPAVGGAAVSRMVEPRDIPPGRPQLPLDTAPEAPVAETAAEPLEVLTREEQRDWLNTDQGARQFAKVHPEAADEIVRLADERNGVPPSKRFHELSGLPPRGRGFGTGENYRREVADKLRRILYVGPGMAERPAERTDIERMQDAAAKITARMGEEVYLDQTGTKLVDLQGRELPRELVEQVLAEPETVPAMPEAPEREAEEPEPPDLETLGWDELRARAKAVGVKVKGTKQRLIEDIRHAEEVRRNERLVQEKGLLAGEGEGVSGPHVQQAAEARPEASKREVPREEVAKPRDTSRLRPWEMTREEFRANPTEAGDYDRRARYHPRPTTSRQAEGNLRIDLAHAKSIRTALQENRQVPPEVLAEYPGLTASSTLDELIELARRPSKPQVQREADRAEVSGEEVGEKQPWQMTQEEFSTYEIPLVSDEQRFPQIRRVRRLFSENGIDIEDIGVTGSRAAGVAESSSDIDIYVRVPAAQFHRADDIAARLSKEGIDVLVNWRGIGVAGGVLRGTKTHKRLVARAVAEGKPVPAEVLNDYPDLQAKQPPALSTKAASARKELDDAVKSFADYFSAATFSTPIADPKLIALSANVVGKAIKAGVYTFADLVHQLAKVHGVENVRRIGDALRAEWQKRKRSDSRLDEAADVEQILAEPQALLTELPEPDPSLARAGADLLDNWFAERDEKAKEAETDQLLLQQAVMGLTGAKRYGDAERELDMAIQVYIDLKGKAEEQIRKWWGELSDAQRALVRRSQNLSPQERALAEHIIVINTVAGKVAQAAGVIREALENYTMRLWEPIGEQRREGTPSKFAPYTARAKQRVYESILEGWAKGRELRIKGATEAQRIARTQVAQAIADRELLKLGATAGVISDSQVESDWVQIEHPNFRIWKPVGYSKKGKVYGRNIFKAPDGRIYQRVPLYAAPALAKHLNNALGESKLNEVWSVVPFLTKWNAAIKHTVLTTSLYHHQAFLRSYMLGSSSVDVVTAWREGRTAIEGFIPELRELVRGGLTYGLQQEWEAAGQEMTAKIPILGPFMKRQTDFLFNKMGPYLKVQAALLEYRRLLAKHATELENGTMTRHEIAKYVAGLINADFGGLHLARIGRNPTAQHLFRLFFLAPDWTESNVRTATGLLKSGVEGRLYRDFWARVLLKGLGTTILFNLVMAGFDDEDFWTRYQKAWKEGHLRWLDVDVTPIYRALGGKDGKRKYFSLIGHFRDPIKFVAGEQTAQGIPDVMRSLEVSAKHKGSVLTRIGIDVLTGRDWKGQTFTSFSELLGVDDKGYYKTTRRGYHTRGERKGGKHRGQLVKWEHGASVQPVGFEQSLSWFAYETRGAMPIQVQNAIAFMLGEIDGFDAITRSAGIMTATSYPESK